MENEAQSVDNPNSHLWTSAARIMNAVFLVTCVLVGCAWIHRLRVNDHDDHFSHAVMGVFGLLNLINVYTLYRWRKARGEQMPYPFFDSRFGMGVFVLSIVFCVFALYYVTFMS